MKTNSIQQEILLVIGTGFSSTKWAEKNSPSAPQFHTEKGSLEEACWNGLLKDIIPEILEETFKNKNIYLWQIRACDSFLELDFGEYPEAKDTYFSIDPYHFWATQAMN